MSVFNNGLLGFSKQVADIQTTLDSSESLQTALDGNELVIQEYIGPIGYCGPWMQIGVSETMLNGAWYGCITNDPTSSPPITGGKFNVPFAGMYMLVGAFFIDTPGSGTNIENVEFRIRNDTTSTTKGNGYLSCGNLNNPSAVHTGALGSCMSIPFSVGESEVENDFTLQANNWSNGTYSSDDNAVIVADPEYKIRWVYLGAGTL